MKRRNNKRYPQSENLRTLRHTKFTQIYDGDCTLNTIDGKTIGYILKNRGDDHRGDGLWRAFFPMTHRMIRLRIHKKNLHETGFPRRKDAATWLYRQWVEHY